jgi:hypothetical protein
MECPPWLVDRYAPIDFSNVPGFPHERPNVESGSIPNFYGYDDSTIVHILSFMEFISIIGIIHEDVVIILFVRRFQMNAKE